MGPVTQLRRSQPSARQPARCCGLSVDRASRPLPAFQGFSDQSRPEQRRSSPSRMYDRAMPNMCSISDVRGADQPASSARSYTFKLAPTRTQERALEALVEQQRRLYNAALEQRRDAWRCRQVSVSRVDQFKELTRLLPEEPELKLFGVQVARGTLWRLDRAFDAFFRRVRASETAGFPRFQSAERFTSIAYPEPSGWRLVGADGTRDGRLRVQGVGAVRIRLHRDLPGELRTLTVYRSGGSWWAAVTCRGVRVLRAPYTGRECGLDRGVAVLAATSDGDLFANPRHFALAAGRLGSAQQALSRSQHGSKRRRRARSRVRAIHRTIARQRRDANHKLSRKIVSDFDRIVLEDLQIKNMTRSARGSTSEPGIHVAQKRGLNRVILDAGWGQLAGFLSYKAADAGRSIEFVHPSYTSQTCSECGVHDGGGRETRDLWNCRSCGVRLHADVNAARNILHRAGSARMSKAA